MEVMIIMTLSEYIDEQFPIDKMIELYNSDPITRIMEADSLPCDKVMMYDGKLQKVVEISDGEYISVFDLISMEASEAATMPIEFQEVYNAYMDNIELTDVSVDDILNLSRKYKKMQMERKERLN